MDQTPQGWEERQRILRPPWQHLKKTDNPVLTDAAHENIFYLYRQSHIYVKETSSVLQLLLKV